MCDYCGCSLAGKHYFSTNGQIMCSEHGNEVINCHECHQKIEGSILIALKKQKQFHPGKT
jgi:Zn-finger protein